MPSNLWPYLVVEPQALLHACILPHLLYYLT
jgi:hypothetical protein